MANERRGSLGEGTESGLAATPWLDELVLAQDAKLVGDRGAQDVREVTDAPLGLALEQVEDIETTGAEQELVTGSRRVVPGLLDGCDER